MKVLYTILFFADTFTLIVLAFSFLKLLDAHAGWIAFALLIGAIVFCIVLLVYFLAHYLKLPSPQGRRKI